MFAVKQMMANLVQGTAGADSVQRIYIYIYVYVYGTPFAHENGRLFFWGGGTFIFISIPVVPHEAVAEVSRRGKL